MVLSNVRDDIARTCNEVVLRAKQRAAARKRGRASICWLVNISQLGGSFSVFVACRSMVRARALQPPPIAQRFLVLIGHSSSDKSLRLFFRSVVY